MELKKYISLIIALAFSLTVVAPATAYEEGVELFAPGIISTYGFELGVSFSPDGLTFYFAKIGDGFASDHRA